VDVTAVAKLKVDWMKVSTATLWERRVEHHLE
jgi:hypothetical protein